MITLGAALAALLLMLSVLDAAWVQPVSYPRPEELVDVLASRADRPEQPAPLSRPDEGVEVHEVRSECGLYLR